MPEVRIIIRQDRMPECCILCGRRSDHLIRLKFAPRRRLSIEEVMTANSLMARVKRLTPTIAVSLPFCARHGRLARLKQRFQSLLMLSAFSSLIVGGAAYWWIEGSWPMIVGGAAGALLALGAHHFNLKPIEVTPHSITLGGAHAQFAEEFTRLNCTLPVSGSSG